MSAHFHRNQSSLGTLNRRTMARTSNLNLFSQMIDVIFSQKPPDDKQLSTPFHLAGRAYLHFWALLHQSSDVDVSAQSDVRAAQNKLFERIIDVLITLITGSKDSNNPTSPTSSSPSSSSSSSKDKDKDKDIHNIPQYYVSIETLTNTLTFLLYIPHFDYDDGRILAHALYRIQSNPNVYYSATQSVKLALRLLELRVVASPQAKAHYERLLGIGSTNAPCMSSTDLALSFDPHRASTLGISPNNFINYHAATVNVWTRLVDAATILLSRSSSQLDDYISSPTLDENKLIYNERGPVLSYLLHQVTTRGTDLIASLFEIIRLQYMHFNQTELVHNASINEYMSLLSLSQLTYILLSYDAITKINMLHTFHETLYGFYHWPKHVAKHLITLATKIKHELYEPGYNHRKAIIEECRVVSYNSTKSATSGNGYNTTKPIFYLYNPDDKECLNILNLLLTEEYDLSCLPIQQQPSTTSPSSPGVQRSSSNTYNINPYSKVPPHAPPHPVMLQIVLHAISLDDPTLSDTDVLYLSLLSYESLYVYYLRLVDFTTCLIQQGELLKQQKFQRQAQREALLHQQSTASGGTVPALSIPLTSSQDNNNNTSFSVSSASASTSRRSSFTFGATTQPLSTPGRLRHTLIHQLKSDMLYEARLLDPTTTSPVKLPETSKVHHRFNPQLPNISHVRFSLQDPEKSSLLSKQKNKAGFLSLSVDTIPTSFIASDGTTQQLQLAPHVTRRGSFVMNTSPHCLPHLMPDRSLLPDNDNEPSEYTDGIASGQGSMIGYFDPRADPKSRIFESTTLNSSENRPQLTRQQSGISVNASSTTLSVRSNIRSPRNYHNSNNLSLDIPQSTRNNNTNSININDMALSPTASTTLPSRLSNLPPLQLGNEYSTKNPHVHTPLAIPHESSTFDGGGGENYDETISSTYDDYAGVVSHEYDDDLQSSHSTLYNGINNRYQQHSQLHNQQQQPQQLVQFTYITTKLCDLLRSLLPQTSDAVPNPLLDTRTPETHISSKRIVRLAIVGNDQLLHEIVTAWKIITIYLPSLLEPFDIRWYLAPMSRNHLASHIARHDAWYRRYTYVPFRAQTPYAPWINPHDEMNDVEDFYKGSTMPTIHPMSLWFRDNMITMVRHACNYIDVNLYVIYAYSDHLQKIPDHIVFAQRMELIRYTPPHTTTNITPGMTPGSPASTTTQQNQHDQSQQNVTRPIDLVVQYNQTYPTTDTGSITDVPTSYTAIVLSNIPHRQDITFPSDPTHHSLEIGALVHPKTFDPRSPTSQRDTSIISLVSDPRQRVNDVTFTAMQDHRFQLLVDGTFFGPYVRATVHRATDKPSYVHVSPFSPRSRHATIIPAPAPTIEYPTLTRTASAISANNQVTQLSRAMSSHSSTASVSGGGASASASGGTTTNNSTTIATNSNNTPSSSQQQQQQQSPSPPPPPPLTNTTSLPLPRTPTSALSSRQQLPISSTLLQPNSPSNASTSLGPSASTHSAGRPGIPPISPTAASVMSIQPVTPTAALSQASLLSLAQQQNPALASSATSTTSYATPVFAQAAGVPIFFRVQTFFPTGDGSPL